MSNTLDEIRQKIFNDISPHSFGFMGAKSFAPENVDYILALITEANKAGYRKGYEHCLVGKKPTEQLKEKL